MRYRSASVDVSSTIVTRRIPNGANLEPREIPNGANFEVRAVRDSARDDG
jgi:hypothetical protein